MNPILYFIYQFLKILVKTVYRIFFSHTTLIKAERLKFDHPAIVVSNHPNTLLDPLNVASRVKKVVFFLANAGLFKHPILGRILNTFYCIPIERPQDVGGRRIKNDDNFARCDAFLKGGGCLYIAPEGTSDPERKIRRIKTGTARIALSAESKSDFSLNLAIIPVGLTYSAFTDFRSEVLVNVGAPIPLADYQEDYAREPKETVRQITAKIEESLQQLTLHTTDHAQEQLLYRLEIIQTNEAPTDKVKSFHRLQATLQNIQALPQEQQKELEVTAETYFQQLADWNINDQATKGRPSSPLKFLLGFPFFLYGWLNNYLAFSIPAWLAKKLNLFIGYTSTVKILGGLLTIPIFYTLQTYLVYRMGGDGWIALIYLASLLPFGWLAWQFRKQWKQWQKSRRFQRLSNKQQQQLLEKRQMLLSQVEAFSTLTAR